ncbi:radical SAM protein [Prosthecochloris sp.]|uniref:B12-binding domain-containing radical SAM protein n=1 Tax=Prosthecochloris sp. TaxID=290513 RepID=UPI00257F464D|nr:radical SAM protein [Prosthecochloris sp.]
MFISTGSSDTSVKSFKILLVAPKGKKDSKSNQKPLFHMALGVLVSITPPEHKIDIIDEHFGDTVDYDADYDLVGITARTIDATRAYEIADNFRKKGKTVILGGIHTSFNPDEASQHADTIVCGEAENMWGTILNDLENHRLKPYYNAKDFPPVKEIVPLDYKRIAKASLREKVDTTKSIPIYITRGCPYNCSFCVTPNFTGKLYRRQKPEDLKAQIEDAKEAFFKKNGTSSKPWFMLCDENLGINKKRLWQALDMIKECNIMFSVFLSMNFLEDEETVKKLVDAGCFMALVGIESIKQSNLEAYNKSHVNTPEKIIEIIDHCRKAGLNVQGNFLINPSLDNYDDMNDLVDFISRNNIFMPIMQIITPYPGTSMYKEYKEKGLITDEDWEKYNAINVVIRSPHYNSVEFQYRFMQTYYKAYSWKNIINRITHNPHPLMGFVTSFAFRKNLHELLETFESEHGLKRSNKLNLY